MKDNFPRAAAKLEVLFWGLLAKKLPDPQTLGKNRELAQVQITPVFGAWGGTEDALGLYLEWGCSALLTHGRAADSDFTQAIILPAAAARS